MRTIPLFALLVGLSVPVSSSGATFTVTTNADAGAGSLRDAIAAANGSAGSDTIVFNIGAGNAQVIELSTALPDVTDAVVIDGTTQPGYAGAPIVTIDGPGVGEFGNGLTIRTSSVVIRGLVIVDFGESGIQIENGSANVVITGNYIGVDASGAVAKPNLDGIRIMDDADDVAIGGPGAGDRNVISGNRGSGITSWPVHETGAADRIVIRSNIIGLDATGTAAMPNVNGIELRGGEAHRIGGTAAGEGNVISGNTQEGIQIAPGFNVGITYEPLNVIVQGNLIGTDASGRAAVPNGTTGVSLYGDRSTTVGGDSPGARNVISSSGWFGVSAGVGCFSNTQTCYGSEDTVIEGNFIGTDIDGSSEFGNALAGVSVVGAQRATIRGNVISGNETGVSAIRTSGFDQMFEVTGLSIVSNLIGTDATGTVALPNRLGVFFYSAMDALVGGIAEGDGNVIRFNVNAGIVALGPGSRFYRNSIDDNGGSGIAAANGILPPVLTSATLDGSTLVHGTVAGVANHTFRIEFFNSPVADPSGFGEGRNFLGSIDVTTDALGSAPIAAGLAAVSTGTVITATSTDLALQSTSQFSNAVKVMPPAVMTVSSPTIVEGDASGTSATFVVSLSKPATEDVTLEYTTTDETASAPSDYAAATGTATIPAGRSSTTIAVEVHGDAMAEADETFRLNVRVASGPATGDVQARATITNDDPATAEIPTASEWGLLIMALVLGMAGAYTMRT